MIKIVRKSKQYTCLAFNLRSGLIISLIPADLAYKLDIRQEITLPIHQPYSYRINFILFLILPYFNPKIVANK